MKTRNGFVSNSSSTSFIVRHLDKHIMEYGPILTKKEIRLLEKNGFKATRLCCPSHLDHIDTDNESWILEDTAKSNVINYGYWVSCNQNDVMYLLVKHNIPFIASIHYGHEVAVYRRNAKNIEMFTNYGNKVETYYSDKSIDQLKNDPVWKNTEPYFKINVKKFIKNHEKFEKWLNSRSENHEKFEKWIAKKEKK